VIVSERLAPTDDEVLAAYPQVRLDHLNKHFYGGLLRHELILGRCVSCGTWQTPLRPLCAHCWSCDVVPTPVSGRGSVFLLTLLHQGPPLPGVDYSTPWPLAAVELQEQQGLRLAATLVGCAPGQARVGLAVEVVWIERDGAPWYAFRPTESPGARA
jgi:uncharacterized OB-fold protein